MSEIPVTPNTITSKRFVDANSPEQQELSPRSNTDCDQSQVEEKGDDANVALEEDVIQVLDDFWSLTRKSALKSLQASQHSAEKLQSISSAIMISS